MKAKSNVAPKRVKASSRHAKCDVITGDGWEIRLGDCMDPKTGIPSLKEGSVDHVISDPPYHPGLYEGIRTSASKSKWYLSQRGKDERDNLCTIGSLDDKEILVAGSQILRVTKRWSVIFCSAEQAHAWQEARFHPPKRKRESYYRTGVWVKDNSTPQLDGLGPAQGHETIVIHHTPGARHWNGGGKPAVWYAPTEQGNRRPDHPCPKPVVLMESLVRDFTDHGELILDPYMGSGSTGVAALRLGRRFLGCELREDFFKMAAKRLRATREQRELIFTNG